MLGLASSLSDSVTDVAEVVPNRQAGPLTQWGPESSAIAATSTTRVAVLPNPLTMSDPAEPASRVIGTVVGPFFAPYTSAYTRQA
jgi:hypothetical protein